MDFSKVISPKRRSVPTPNSIIDENGRSVFGTFDKEFEDMDLVKAKNPTHLPNAFNKAKLSLWEAVEVHIQDAIFLTAACDMAIFGKTLTIFYDKKEKIVYAFDKTIPSKNITIAKNLKDGKVTKGFGKDGEVIFENDMNHGLCHIKGKLHGKSLKLERNEHEILSKNYKKHYVYDVVIEYDFQLERISLPCVGVMPFGPNRPLYSQKDFFKASGYLVVGNKRYESDIDTTAIIDDHRGFYPRKAHYDWTCTMGNFEFNGKKEYFAFNLTRNQSIDQYNYNENLIWLKGKTSILPPVTFTKSVQSKDFTNMTVWEIKDEHGMVNLTYKIDNMFPMVLHALVANIDYYVTFGELSGYLYTEDGTKYELKDVVTIGEDKSLLV